MTTEKQEMDKALFAQLVITLATSTMHHLGKLVNPATQKAELNLEAAQSTIDLLDMLEAKTQGNLDKEETEFLKTTLSSLKINFVETSQKAPEQTPAATEPPPSQAQPETDKDDKKRFRKSYG